MNLQWLKLLRIFADPRITRTPLRVLTELRRQGKKRMPESADRQLACGSTLPLLRLAKNWLAGENLTRHRGQWVLNSFLPPFPSPAFDRMFENLLSGRRLSPVSAFLAVTSDCPFDCPHCSAKLRRGGNLTAEQWQNTLSQLLAHGVSIVGFTGGEPLTRPDLPGLVRTAADGGATTILFSSGAGFDEPTAKKLQAAGLWSVCISLDHSDPAECNRFRGSNGAYDTAVAALRLAARHGFYTMIGSVARRSFVADREFERLHELAGKLGVHELRLVEPMPCGRLKNAPEDLLLAPEHVASLREFHRRTNRRGHKPKVCAFNEIESPELFGCGGGTQHLYIDAAGEVCPCDFTPLSFGNVTREPFAAIWTRMTGAMGNPRRECFLQRHHRLIDGYATNDGPYPLPPETSCRICAEVGRSKLPDYFRMVTGRDE